MFSESLNALDNLTITKQKENKMNKQKFQKLNVGELLVGQEYHSRIRTGFGEILEARQNGNVNFPNGFVYKIRVSKNNYDPSSKEFWATVAVIA